MHVLTAQHRRGLQSGGEDASQEHRRAPRSRPRQEVGSSAPLAALLP